MTSQGGILGQIKAVKCDVYSRVVGYYRPVQDWNRGKREEFADRAMVDIPEEEPSKKSSVHSGVYIAAAALMG